MGKPDDISEDVWANADGLAAAFLPRAEIAVRDQLRDSIIAAVRAERERCAKVADRLAASAATTSASVTRLQSEMAERVAAAIRQGEVTT